MDLTGIENEAEFFPAGTLSDVLEVELSDITSRWNKDDSGINPAERIKTVGDRCLTTLTQLRNTTDKNSRKELASQLESLMCEGLGYEVKKSAAPLALESGGFAPLLNQTFDADGKCRLWIIESPLVANGEEDADPLGLSFSEEQFQDIDDGDLSDLSIEELLNEGVFSLQDAPRYVLIASPAQWVLIDSRKWAARSVLRFNLQEIFSRQDRDTYRLMACLIAKEARVPVSGRPLSDRLEEEAQRNANTVTTSLKKTVRDAIEILGQEVLDCTEGKFLKGEKRGVWIDGETLSLECLRFMYRLLFILYAESNPRLGILNIKDPVYASGYSMEALRDLESVRLRTPKEKEGTYLWESLQHIFGFLFEGEQHVLKLPPVKVSLLDPESTPLLNSVKLRNEAVQKIIRLLSLKQTNKKSTSRISYSKLGIGQLGAVYETLISFTGTVAKEDMIELKGDSKDRVAKEDVDESEGDVELDDVESRVDKVDLLAPTYFVPRRRIGEFNPEAVVFEGTQAKIYPKGSFTYRLAGRNREKTAAYYTPEPLARLLVKHLLMERCRDLTADEILELKILEPAMGSAAFLVETTNQLADLYLERKQVEVGRVIPQEDIILEKQKVRSYIADRNCFGVDLNPTAVELGAISLWLNGLHKGEFSPWFGDQLHAGNSLIGARRAVYPASQLKGKGADLWLKHPPKEIGWKEERPENTVYQWLLPAEDMAAFDKDKSISAFAGEHQEQIKAWRKAGFYNPLEQHEINLVQRLTKVADELFEIVASELARTRDAANDEITLWPEHTMAGAKGVGYQKKEILKQRLLGEDHAQNTLPFKRLKTAMDVWCALWLWPIEQAEKLPSRREFLEGMRILLEGGFSADGSLSAGAQDDFAVGMSDLFDEPVDKPATQHNMGLFQETNVEAFIEEYDWLQVATKVAEEARFVHYDLIFADILKARGGFDLIVGNPPWAKMEWEEGQVIADLDPKYLNLSSTEARKVLPGALSRGHIKHEFLSEYVSCTGLKTGLASPAFFKLIQGSSSNLYKCFCELSFRLSAEVGVVGLLHPDGHLSDTKSKNFRKEWYFRIRKHFHFRNELKRKMFSEIGNTLEYSVNIYSRSGTKCSFIDMYLAFLPIQVEESFSDDGRASPPPIKINGKWSTRGHRSRLVEVDDAYISSLHNLMEDDSLPKYQTRFIPCYNASISKAIAQIGQSPNNKSSGAEYGVSGIWTEGTAERDLKIITSECGFPKNRWQVILSSPMIYVGNPFYKVPNRGCSSHRDFAPFDLSNLYADYLPRTNFIPAKEQGEYEAQIPTLKWNRRQRVTDVSRAVVRRRIPLHGERSLIAALLPAGPAHIHALQSVTFKNQSELLDCLAGLCSLPMDFMIKALGQADFSDSLLSSMPHFELCDTARSRILRLNCLSPDYAEVWNLNSSNLSPLPWSCSDERMAMADPVQGPKSWDPTAGLFTEFTRRIALIEIDVLVSLALGLTLDQLIEIYRIYFPVLQENEAGTWYEQNGRIVWTCSKGLPSVGYLNEKGKSPSRKEWESILESNPSELVCTAIDDTMPDGPKTVERRFVGPFFKCDRIEDYKCAWAHFEKLKQEGKL